MRLEAKKYLYDMLVWDIVETKLPALRRQVTALLEE